MYTLCILYCISIYYLLYDVCFTIIYNTYMADDRMIYYFFRLCIIINIDKRVRATSSHTPLPSAQLFRQQLLQQYII